LGYIERHVWYVERVKGRPAIVFATLPSTKDSGDAPVRAMIATASSCDMLSVPSSIF
jgi:hypothetical protein